MLSFKGFLYAVITSATFGLIPLFTIPLLHGGMNTPSILFYRFSMAAAMMWAYSFFIRKSLRISIRELITLAWLSLLYIGSAVFLFSSYLYLSSGIATTMMFLYPVFVALIMMYVFKEKKSLWTMFAIVLAVLGVAMLSWNGSDGGVSFFGILLAVLSGLSYGVYIIAVNKSSVRTMSSEKLTFYVFLFTAVFLLAGTLLTGSFQTVEAWQDIFNLALLALVPTIISNLTLVLAIKAIGSTFTSVLGAMEPLTAMAVGVFVFSEPFTLSTALGVFLIIAAVSVVVLAPALEKGYRTGKFLYITKIKRIHPHIIPHH